MGKNHTPPVAARSTLPKYVHAVQYTAIDSAYTQGRAMTERRAAARRSAHQATPTNSSR